MGRESNKKRRATSAQTAREKAAAARAEQQRIDQRRRALVILSSVVAFAVVAAVIAVVALTHKSHSDNIRTVGPASVVNAIKTVPVATLDAVGTGGIATANGPKPITGTPLTSAGKPELLYIGAEFCPYCAAERWSMAVALSRFGTLSGLKLTKSSSSDVYPNTATLDFISTKYASKYLSFVAVENEDRAHNSLQPVTSAEQALWTRYEPGGATSYPFLDIGNKYAVTTPTFVPTMLAGLTQAQIASRLGNATDPVAQAVDGAANLLTASICGMTNNQPADVCSDKTIAGLQTQINGQTSS